MQDNLAERIERALARIEAAAAMRADTTDRLERRHIRLRGRIEEAVAALDALIDHEIRCEPQPALAAED